jgi:hypothetical protein
MAPRDSSGSVRSPANKRLERDTHYVRAPQPSRLANEAIAVTQPDIDLKEQLRALEESHLRHEVRSSPQAMQALLGEEFVEFGSSGRAFDRAATIALVSGQAAFHSCVDEFRVRVLAPEVALTTYRLSVWSDSEDQARVTLRSSVWMHRAGRWVLVFHQGTLASSGAT